MSTTHLSASVAFPPCPHQAEVALMPHLPSLLGAADIAAIFGVGERTLQRLARRHWRCSPQTVLDMARLRHACTLLRTTDQPCHRIGQAIGIFNETYLCGWFKRMTGQTMGEYRRQCHPETEVSG